MLVGGAVVGDGVDGDVEILSAGGVVGGVVAAAAGEDVGAEPAVEGVVAGAAGEGIVGKAAPIKMSFPFWPFSVTGKSV